MRQSKNGFSLIELMVAVFILSSALLLIIGMFTFLFNASKKGVDLTAGTAAAERYMEEWLYQNESMIYGLASSNYQVDMVKPALNGITFRCRIFVSSPAAALRKVNTTVYWWVNADGSAIGAKSYRVQQADGSWTTVTTAQGKIAEYGNTYTTITKFIFAPGM
jgi:prepilin-type N-terminal cleavage/methylation domain-containing protein